MSDSTRYDDRIDVDTELTLTETFAMIGRSLGLLTKVRKLFAYKFVFAIVAVLPAIVLPLAFSSLRLSFHPRSPKSRRT